MRKNIYGVFRALRHFGVSETEIEKVAKAYKTWLHFPIEEKSPYNWVYYLNGRLISMPFSINQLFEDHLIGYAVGTKVFMFLHAEDVRRNEVEAQLLSLKKSLDARMLGAEGNADLQVHLPTAEEASLFFTQFASNWLANVMTAAGEIVEQLPDDGNEYELQFPINNQIPKMWIAPSADEPEKTAIKLGFNNSGPYCKTYRPSAKAKMTVTPITDLREGDFIGKLTRYGVPTQATIDMVYELFANRY